MRWKYLLPVSLVLAGCGGVAAPLEPDAGASRCVTRVASGSALAAALAGARCGTSIVLADGKYRGDFALRMACPAGQSIAVQAEHPLGAVLASRLLLAGDHATVRGLRFDGADAVVAMGGTGNRLLRSSFTGWRGVAVRATAGSGAEIGFNEFASPAPWSLGGDSRQGISSNEPNGGLHLNAWVHHNYFHDFPAKPRPANYASGQSDALEICGGGQPVSDRRSGWTIEDNLVERHHGGYGIIDILCGGTTVRHNTVLASPGGRIDLRRGSYSILAGNWIEDAGGSVIHGGYQQALGNHLADLSDGGYPDLLVGLVLTAGTVPWDYAGPPKLADGTPVHQAADHVLLVGNTAPRLEIGLRRGPAYGYAVRDTVVEGHVGPITDDFAQGTTVVPRADRPVPQAARLEPASVGPLADPDDDGQPGCTGGPEPRP